MFPSVRNQLTLQTKKISQYCWSSYLKRLSLWKILRQTCSNPCFVWLPLESISHVLYCNPFIFSRCAFVVVLCYILQIGGCFSVKSPVSHGCEIPSFEKTFHWFVSLVVVLLSSFTSSLVVVVVSVSGLFFHERPLLSRISFM